MEKEQRIAWEAQCIQEEPPACSTTCPLHVDVRQFMKEMAEGDVNEAYKVLRKNLPFVGSPEQLFSSRSQARLMLCDNKSATMATARCVANSDI